MFKLRVSNYPRHTFATPLPKWCGEGVVITQLTTAEKDTLVMFLLDPGPVAVPSTPLTYADELLGPKRRRMGATASKYSCLKFVVPTSTMVERFFSVAKYIMTDHRKQMHSVNVEMIIFLRANASYWNVYSLG
ncbi:hypothetical protein AaE_012442 [Aphanomyces astaci]|uniref:HAT C-terminal dimerisation domain-containing protein n=1 Tax=Aphanomyces astaci TaxID=112090 RepID=A0A6A4ZB74_APHAT|nr:hypothetical protein AaE_012442 [Aphanomyces astaci]